MSHLELRDWLENEAAKRMKTAIGRRDSGRAMRDITASELRSAKALAEKVAGRKLPLATVTEKAARANADMQDGIASKVETEALQLSKWADELTRLTALLEDRLALAGVLYGVHNRDGLWEIAFTPTRTHYLKMADRLIAYLKPLG